MKETPGYLSYLRGVVKKRNINYTVTSEKDNDLMAQEIDTLIEQQIKRSKKLKRILK
jgi:hypothetical protein